ncbi:hypothetical protein [Rosenbergiella nectarea]|uniref:hypothetical protein n=1 Tax=Rosenbergiella nectarea TaxID=988801 RepID=UPI001F4D7B48|nr:hypothetical protein [Rosenbergiella nectarea]
MAFSRVCKGWTQEIVTLHGVVVGLNGGFVQIAQLEANCLSGVECQAWYEKPQP